MQAIKKNLFIAAILILIPFSLSAQTYPKPAGFVNDFANVMQPQTKAEIEGLLSSFEKETGIEVAVATIPSLEGDVVENVAVKLFKDWGIGKKNKDNGLLFLIAPTDRRMRIEVGYGLEGVINDALAGRILDEYVMPNFKAGDLNKGIAAGTLAIVKTIVDKEGLSFSFDTTALTYTPKQKKGGPLTTIAKIFLLIIMIIVFIRHPWLFLLLLSSGGGGGRSGGGFGGGFGGFGGGMSGGGGASRGW